MGRFSDLHQGQIYFYGPINRMRRLRARTSEGALVESRLAHTR